MKQDILIIQPLMPELSEVLHQHYHCHRLYEQTDVAAFLEEHAGKIKAVATRGDVGLAADLMAALPALELIAVFGVGTDGIDLSAARDRDITVTITSGILTDDVADLALALMLGVSRQIVAQDAFLRSGAWQERPPQLGYKLCGKRVGLWGWVRLVPLLPGAVRALICRSVTATVARAVSQDGSVLAICISWRSSVISWCWPCREMNVIARWWMRISSARWGKRAF